jgi:hypothetical protein
MTRMARVRGHQERGPALVLVCLALIVSLGQGCSRSGPLHKADASSSATEQSVPFHSDANRASDSGGASASSEPDPKQAASLPFRAGSPPRILPAGTLLTVQLENSLSAATAHLGDAFTGSVAAPITIEQDTVIERGAAVAGRIESERSLAARHGLSRSSGYFRLTLSSVTIEGRQLALQTSSLFARGTFQPSLGVAVQKGRRLTFRLTAPVTLDDPNSTANPQSSAPSTE